MSRDLIADSVELVMHAERFDALVGIAGCDKSEPGMLMAMARMNLPSVYLYGGTILPGTYKGKDITIQDVFEAVGAHAKGTIDDAELLDDRARGLPRRPGRARGCTPPTRWPPSARRSGCRCRAARARPPSTTGARCSRASAGVAGRRARARRAARVPREVMTKQAFENAIAVVMALAGSTNAVLHLLAIAREAHVDLQLDDFDRIGRTVPHLVDVRPAGRFVMSDIDRVGGVPVVMKELLEAGHLHGDCITVTGRTLAREPRGDGHRGARRRRDRASAVRPDPPVGRARDPARQPRPRRRRDEGRGRRGASCSRGRPGRSTRRRPRSTP